MILNISEAALHLGFKSRTPLQRLLGDGLLEDYRAGHRGRAVLLETAPDGRPTLRERVQALTQHRIGSPLWDAPPVEAGPDWQRIATKLNRYLGGGRWPAPPWSADQAATVAMCLSLAQEAACD